MCGTCHIEQDDRFPSTLELPTERPRCSDCHNRLENPETDWIKDRNQPYRFSRIDGGDLADLLQSTVRKVMDARGFIERTARTASALTLEFSIRSRRVRGDRYLPETMAVVICEIEVTLLDAQEGRPVFRRLAPSKPVVAPTEKEAQRLALLDAWRVLAPVLLDACCVY